MKPATVALIWLALFALLTTNVEGQELISSILGAVLHASPAETAPAAISSPSREPTADVAAPSSSDEASPAPVVAIPHAPQTSPHQPPTATPSLHVAADELPTSNSLPVHDNQGPESPASEPTSPPPPSITSTTVPATETPRSTQPPREPVVTTARVSPTPPVPASSAPTPTVMVAPSRSPRNETNSTASPVNVAVPISTVSTRVPIATVSSTETPKSNTTTGVPQAPTRTPSSISTASPSSSSNSTADVPVVPTDVPLAPKRNATKPTTSSNITTQVTSAAPLAPFRVSVNVSAVSPSQATKCGADDYKRMYQYYVTNKRIQDDCTKATGGYTFPFGGEPSHDQVISMARSGACVILLKGVSQVLTTECLLGDMPVRITAARILAIAANQLSLKGSDSVASDADAQVEARPDAVRLSAASAVGASSGSGSTETTATTKVKAKTKSVKLSQDLKIVEGWEYAPVRDQKETAALVHADVLVSAVLPSEVNANAPEDVPASAPTTPSGTPATSTTAVSTNFDAHTLSIAESSAGPSLPVTPSWIAAVIGATLLFV